MAWFPARRPRSIDRLRDYASRQDEFDRSRDRNEGSSASLRPRQVLRKVLQTVGGWSSRTVGRQRQEEIRQQLVWAGRPGGLAPAEFAGLKLLLGLLLAAIGLLVLVALALAGLRASPLFLLFFEGGMLLAGYLSATFYLDHLVRLRARRIQQDLPDVLDLLTVAVEAGLGLDQAMYWVGRRFQGPLGEELVRVVEEVRMGRPRSEALKDLANRTQIRDLRSIARAIFQADRLGVQLSNVLRAQSDNLREERLMRGREQAQKAPVKMLVPLILFIFPSLFIVLMGPAMIQAYHILMESNILGAP